MKKEDHSQFQKNFTATLFQNLKKNDEEEYKIQGFSEVLLDQTSLEVLQSKAAGSKQNIESETIQEDFFQKRSQSPGRKSIKEKTAEKFYKISEPKPLLSKNYIDFSKPKVLIKQIYIRKQPEELSQYKINSNVTVDESKNLKGSLNSLSMERQEKNTSKLSFSASNSLQASNQPTTMWQRYLVKSNYDCLYMKYFRGDLKQYFSINENRDAAKEQRRKFRLELLKTCHNNQNLWNTYFIDLDFIAEAGTSLIRNLVDEGLEAIYSRWYSNGNKYEEIQFEQHRQNVQEIEQNDEKGEKSEEKSHQKAENQISPHYPIQFDSKFECANLFAVFQQYEKKAQSASQSRCFDLVLQNDINTKGYTNWFYFCIKSPQIGQIRLNIVNMQKFNSLFNNGMKVLVFSYQKWKQEGVEWIRDGYDYSYKRNTLIKTADGTMRFNTLSFCLNQQYRNDMIYIAANVPYSYSRLMQFLSGIEKITRINSNIYFKKQMGTISISSNIAPILTLTWKRDNKKGKQPEKEKLNQNSQNTQKADHEKDSYKKKIIGIIARQHPGETLSSFVMEGFINSLVYLSNKSSMELLKRYIFKIVPMVNVDGVIYGNGRCDISGTDINRKWINNPNKFLYPILHSVKKMFQQLVVNEKYEMDYFIDLHGHSKKLGTFVYACKTGDEVESRMFPWLMQKITNKFYHEYCTFGLASYKRQTARGSMSNYTINKRAMTLETSFYGWNRYLPLQPSAGREKKENQPAKHFELKDLFDIGESILIGVKANQDRDPKQFNWNFIKNEIKNYIGTHKKQVEQDQEEQSGSDSDPSEDQMTFEEKTASFLPSIIASKIGLVQIKVVERRKKKKNNDALEDDLKDSQIKGKKENFLKRSDSNDKRIIASQLNSLNSGQKRNSLNIKDDPLNSYFSRRLQEPSPSSQYNLFRLRETKSVTKITPFQFTVRPRKSFSTNKIQLAIDIKYHNEISKQKSSSVPSLLPGIGKDRELKMQGEKKKGNFWEKFNEEYENVLIEKKKFKQIGQYQLVSKKR